MKYIMPFIFIATAASCGGGGGKSAPPEPPVTNSSPIAVNDTASTNNGQVITINVLSNDSDANNDALSLTNVSQPSNGTVRIENNALVYTPSSASFAGTETFNYEVSDQQTSASAQVQVNVSQYTSFNGVVAGADALNSSIVRMTIGDEVFETQLDTQNQFAFDYETTNVNSRAVVFSVFIADKMIYTGTPVAFDDIVSQRGTDVLFSFESQNQLILSPLSTAIEALTLRFDPDTRRALEEQIDADMLLQLAALTSLIAKEELTIEGDILSALSNDDLLTSMAQSLLLEDESVSLSSENVDGTEGLVVTGARLSSEIDEVRSTIAPYLSFNTQVQTQATLNRNSAQPLYDFFQLKPSYNGRVASYNFIGAQLSLMDDGSGTYWAEFGKSNLSWEQQGDQLVVNLETPILLNANMSLVELFVKDLIDADTYANARVFGSGDVFTTYINSFSLTRLFDGESVDIATTNFQINVVLDDDVWFFADAQAIGVDNYVTQSTQNLEYTKTTEETYFPFNTEEVVGVWGFAVAATGVRKSDANDATILESIFADLVTFDADGTAQSRFHSVSGTWAVNDQGVLVLSQNDGWEVTYTRIAQDQQAGGMLIRASKPGSPTYSQFRMAVKQSVTQLDVAILKDESVLWNGNWSLSNPSNYNADGSFKATVYYGLQFSNGNTPLSYLLGFLYTIGAEVELVIRYRARYLFENEDNTLTLERRVDRNQRGSSAECDVSEPSCVTFFKRQWTPLGQTEDRFYVLEHFFFNFDLLRDEDADPTLYFQPRGRVIFYEKLDYPSNLVDQ